MFSGPLWIAMEGLSSLLVVQKAGQLAKQLVEEREEDGIQFGLLIATAIAYVASAWWIVVVSGHTKNINMQVPILIHQ
jgi:hypothetical protein